MKVVEDSFALESFQLRAVTVIEFLIANWRWFEISSTASSLTGSHWIHIQIGGPTPTKSNSAFCIYFGSAHICIASFCRPGCCLLNGLKSGMSTETLVSVWLLMPWNFDAKMQLGSRERITLLWKRRMIAAGKQMSMCQPSGEVGPNATHSLPRDKEHFNPTKVIFTLFLSPQSMKYKVVIHWVKGATNVFHNILPFFSTEPHEVGNEPPID